MRRGKCVKCGHNEIIEAAFRTSPISGTSHELGVTYAVGLFGITCQSFGMLVVLTCRRCGYSEMWAYEPENIPIGEKVYGTRLVGAPGMQEGAGRLSIAECDDASGKLSVAEEESES